MLTLPDFAKQFKVHTDAFDLAVGGVLMQDGYPIMYESYKLSDIKKRWSTHEDILVAVHSSEFGSTIARPPHRSRSRRIIGR